MNAEQATSLLNLSPKVGRDNQFRDLLVRSHPDKHMDCPSCAHEAFCLFQEAFAIVVALPPAIGQDTRPEKKSSSKRTKPTPVQEKAAREREAKRVREIGDKAQQIFDSWAHKENWKIADCSRKKGQLDRLIEREGKRARIEIKGSSGSPRAIPHISPLEVRKMFQCALAGEDCRLAYIRNIDFNPQITFIPLPWEMWLKDGVTFEAPKEKDMYETIET
jgi:hypothetical protein